MPSVEVLCATMHQKDFSKIDAMNIQSNVVYANQSDDTRYDEMTFGENQAKMITTATRGVGINRNLSLLYSSGDYLLISDDDLTYVVSYRIAKMLYRTVHVTFLPKIRGSSPPTAVKFILTLYKKSAFL